MRTNITLAVTVAMFACILGGPTGARGQTDPSDAETLDMLIKAIRKADDVRKAAGFYSQGRAIDTDSVKLYQAYMRKALHLGYPRIAFYPAVELKRLEAKDGTAWSVIGYYFALRGKYSQAFPTVMKAAELLSDDASVLHNAGHLVAWYEEMPITPVVPIDAKTTMNSNRDSWRARNVFSRTHSATAGILKKRTERIGKLQETIGQKEDSVDALTTQARQLQAAHKNNSRNIANCDKNMRIVQDRMDKLRYNRSIAGYERTKKQRQYDREMNHEKQYKRSLEVANAAISGKLNTVLDKLGKDKGILEEAQEKLREEETTMPELTWKPPSVDGIVTPDAEPDGQPTIVLAETVNKPVSRKTSAEKDLLIAKMLVSNEALDKAKIALETILKDYPGTEEAAEAKKLLDHIRRSEQPDTLGKPDPEKPEPPNGSVDPSRPAPKDPAVALKMAKMLAQNNRVTKAIEALEALLAEHPRSDEAKEARTLLEELRRIQPEGREDPDDEESTQKDDSPDKKPDAAEIASDAHRTASSDPEVALRLARMLIRNERTERAIELLNGIISEHPRTPAAREAKILLRGINSPED